MVCEICILIGRELHQMTVCLSLFQQFGPAGVQLPTLQWDPSRTDVVTYNLPSTTRTTTVSHFVHSCLPPHSELRVANGLRAVSSLIKAEGGSTRRQAITICSPRRIVAYLSQDMHWENVKCTLERSKSDMRLQGQHLLAGKQEYLLPP